MNKLILLILFSLSYCNSVIGQDSHIHFIEKPDSQKISIYIDQTLFTEFLYSDTLYKQVLYPIYTASGTEITRGYPARPKADERTDHPHQMGLWHYSVYRHQKYKRKRKPIYSRSKLDKPQWIYPTKRKNHLRIHR